MPAQAIQKQKLLYIFLASILLTIGYAAAQSQQGHPWTEITLPSSPNVWTGLNADMLDGLHYADFSARLWSGYDPSTDNIWYNDGGNVGIGTTAPSQKLDVSGNIRASGSLTGSQICIGTDCINSWSDVRDTDWTESGGNVYRTSGNVGIGTATPQAKLEVKDGFIYNTKTDATIARIGLKNSIREWAISAYGNDFAPNGGLVISDETTPRAVMIFNTNGNVGIGTINPQYKLDVNGAIRGTWLCIGSSCRSSWDGISHITKVEKTGCWRGGTHTLQSICPNGYKLLSCAGGPGDLMEDYEGWYITPDFSKNSCFLHIKEPACTDTYDLTYQRVIAICYI